MLVSERHKEEQTACDSIPSDSHEVVEDETWFRTPRNAELSIIINVTCSEMTIHAPINTTEILKILIFKLPAEQLLADATAP
jgi:hypothetical protein